MRARAAAASVVLTGVVLAGAWHEGAGHAGTGTALPGIRVVAPAPASPAASPSSTGDPKKPTAKAKKPASTHRTVDGALVSTPYGDVQVALVISGTRITGVKALHLTDANQHSVRISAGAAPVLRGEVLAAQSAKVDAVSGATYTSDGYLTSLQAAIDAAHL